MSEDPAIKFLDRLQIITKDQNLSGIKPELFVYARDGVLYYDELTQEQKEAVERKT